MTVMNPKKVVLVDAPQEVWHLVKGETDGWRQFGAGDFWGRREDFSLGKMSYIKLLTYEKKIASVTCISDICMRFLVIPAAAWRSTTGPC